MKVDPIKLTPAGLLAMLRAELGVEPLDESNAPLALTPSGELATLRAELGVEPVGSGAEAKGGDHAGDL